MNRANKIFFLRRLLIVCIFFFLHKLPAYGDKIDLNNAIALAMKHNEQIQISILEGAQAHERVREARAAGLPRVDMSVSYDRNWLLPSLVFNGNSVKLGSENNISKSAIYKYCLKLKNEK